MEKVRADLYVAALAVRASFALAARYRHFFEGEEGKRLFDSLNEENQKFILSDILNYPVNSLNEGLFESMIRQANAYFGKQFDARTVYRQRPFKTVKALVADYTDEKC